MPTKSLNVTLRRYTSNRVSSTSHIAYIIEKTLSKVYQWECTEKMFHNVMSTRNGWQHYIDLVFKPTSEKSSPIERVKIALDKARQDVQKFKNNPYIWENGPTFKEISALELDIARQAELDNEDRVPLLDEINLDSIIASHEIVIPRQLIKGSDKDITSHPAFNGIYGRAAHIRRGLMAIDAFQRSSQKIFDNDLKSSSPVKNHVLYYGPPAAAKTRIIRGIKRLLPNGSCYTLDAPSCTKAGIIKILTLFQDACPPIFLVEEIEKMNDLVGWLSLLNEDSEVQKFTHFTQMRFKVNFLCIATCNDKRYLDAVLKGSVSSRFGHQIYVPRPNLDEIRSILQDQVEEIDGNDDWVDACMKLMDKFQVDDPRTIKGWLDYGDSLLDGKAEHDLETMDSRKRHDGRMNNLKKEESEEYLSDQDIARETFKSDYQESLRMLKNGSFS